MVYDTLGVRIYFSFTIGFDQEGISAISPTPYNEYTYHMIKALEEKNDGLFDYTATDAVTCSR